MNKLKMLPASYYKAIWNNNLTICGVENERPQLLGNSVDLMNFFEDINND
jgi:hypothetical protein